MAVPAVGSAAEGGQTMNRRTALVVVLVCLGIGLSPLMAQEKGYAFTWSNFSLELTGAWSRIAPDNLNRAIDYEAAYIQHYYVRRFEYYNDLSGGTYSSQLVYRDGKEFQALRQAIPLGAAIRYQASRTFGLSLGVQSLRGEETSDVGLDVLIEDASAGASTAQYRNDGFTISAKTWMPYLAANFGWDLFRPVRAEIYILGGPIFADLRIWNHRLESVTGGAGILASGSQTIELTGHSTSFAVELGVQVRARILPWLSAFAQAGYAFRQFEQIKGLHTVRTTTEAPLVSENLYSLEGTWWMVSEFKVLPWGFFEAPTLSTSCDYPPSAWNCARVGASVDLSGLQVGVGLSIRL
jgi:hypothetical protein